MAAFLEKGTRPRDHVLLIGTGEGFWWSTRAGAGRADLLARAEGPRRAALPNRRGDRLTDYEAVQISVYQRRARRPRRSWRRFDRHGGTSRQAMEQSRQNNLARA